MNSQVQFEGKQQMLFRNEVDCLLLTRQPSLSDMVTLNVPHGKGTETKKITVSLISSG